MRIWSCLPARNALAAGSHPTVLLAIISLLATAGLAQERWKVQFFYDQQDSSFDIRDIRCPSSRQCIAAGVIVDKDGRQKGAVVVTSDGGANWSQVNVREDPLSLFFLNDSLGWMATDHGIWFTDAGGRSWKKLEALKGIVEVQFLDSLHGYAIGFPKAVYETSDGGKKWTKLAAAAEPPSDPKRTTYDTIAFQGQHGVILGRVEREEREPDSPKLAIGGPQAQRNSAVVIFETLDGGKSWQSRTDSYSGEITRLRLSPEGFAVLLVEYPDDPLRASRVVKWPLHTKDLETVFSQRDRVVADVALLPDGEAVLAAVQPPGNSNQVPIPGKLKLLKTRDWKTWTEMDVDYRAVAQSAVLAAPDAHHMWVATNTGMILGLAQ